MKRVNVQVAYAVRAWGTAIQKGLSERGRVANDQQAARVVPLRRCLSVTTGASVGHSGPSETDLKIAKALVDWAGAIRWWHMVSIGAWVPTRDDGCALDPDEDSPEGIADAEWQSFTVEERHALERKHGSFADWLARRVRAIEKA